MCHIVQKGCDWLIRASKLNRVVQLESGDMTTMEDAVSRCTQVGSYELHLRTRPGVPARVASIEVRSTRVTLPQPKMKSPFVKSCGIRDIATNVLVVEEVNAPKGVTPIRWILLTSLPVTADETKTRQAGVDGLRILPRTGETRRLPRAKTRRRTRLAIHLDWLQKTPWKNRGYEIIDVLKSAFRG